MGEALLDRWVRLKAEIRQHKSAIRRHREQLGGAVAALHQVERESRQAGIALIDVSAEASEAHQAKAS